MIMQRNLIAAFLVGVALAAFGLFSVFGVAGSHSAASVGIIGGSDGPTAIFVSSPAQK